MTSKQGIAKLSFERPCKPGGGDVHRGMHVSGASYQFNPCPHPGPVSKDIYISQERPLFCTYILRNLPGKTADH
jgi:hypothetical protein